MQFGKSEQSFGASVLLPWPDPCADRSAACARAWKQAGWETSDTLSVLYPSRTSAPNLSLYSLNVLLLLSQSLAGKCSIHQ